VCRESPPEDEVIVTCKISNMQPSSQGFGENQQAECCQSVESCTSERAPSMRQQETAEECRCARRPASCQGCGARGKPGGSAGRVAFGRLHSMGWRPAQRPARSALICLALWFPSVWPLSVPYLFLFWVVAVCLPVP
jgi:hypothetical protein